MPGLGSSTPQSPEQPTCRRSVYQGDRRLETTHSLRYHHDARRKARPNTRRTQSLAVLERLDLTCLLGPIVVLASNYSNLHLVRRNGMQKYNNQDHAMMTAKLCAENILAGKQVYDLWQVNQDAEYHESGNAGSTGLRAVPMPVKARTQAPAVAVPSSTTGAIHTIVVDCESLTAQQLKALW